MKIKLEIAGIALTRLVFVSLPLTVTTLVTSPKIDKSVTNPFQTRVFLRSALGEYAILFRRERSLSSVFAVISHKKTGIFAISVRVIPYALSVLDVKKFLVPSKSEILVRKRSWVVAKRKSLKISYARSFFTRQNAKIAHVATISALFISASVTTII